VVSMAKIKADQLDSDNSDDLDDGPEDGGDSE
jgi:hypothetical protein